MARTPSPRSGRFFILERKMIQFRNVSFSYRKEEKVLDSISLELQTGLCLLLGPNGCGKSTLLKLAAGVEIPDAGSVFIDGHDLWKEEIAARKGLAYLPEHPDLTPYASIEEILNLVCRLRERPLEEGKNALEFFGLQHLAHRTVRELSMGQRRRAVFAACYIGSPLYLLLDEPLEGMDRHIQKEILSWIEKHRQSGATIVIVSHTIEPFFKMASAAITIQSGKAFEFTKLPDHDEKKRAFLEQLAERGLPL
jgi:ABC-type multidrug transport system ATPase subunit